MINKKTLRTFFQVFVSVLLLAFTVACDEDEDKGIDNNAPNGEDYKNDHAVFLIIDEESIDNGNEPNNFSELDVNDQIAEVGQRSTLRYFRSNIGKNLELYTGEVGDEGWHALKTIPSSWVNAGPTDNGLENYLIPGPGLGAGDDDREILLDKIPDVTPLRATGLSMLKGQTILAVVYDSDISINYSPLNGNLMGSNLGVVALDVLEVTERKDGSTSSLPRVSVRIRDVEQILALPHVLFVNAPAPESSSEPFDITPPQSVPVISVTPGN